MNNKLENVIVFVNTKIKNVLLKINNNGLNGVFVVNKSRKLLGVITDSDIRKSILKNKFNLKFTAKDLMQKKYLSISYNQRYNKEKILIRSNKILVPILKKLKLIDYIHMSELNNNNKNKLQKILVIGGLGYIGSILVTKLLENNFDVNILDKNYYGNYLNKKILNNPRLKVFHGDCSKKSKLLPALKGCTDVVHLGEIVGDPAVSINEDYSIKNNFEATVFVVSECIKNKINKFIFASSCSVYGNSSLNCTETTKLNPLSLYAKCKIECERSIRLFLNEKFCPVILRLATVYGDSPRKRFDLVVNRFILMAIKKIKIKLFGALSWRPFINVSDVSEIIIKVLKSEEKLVKNQIFNVGFDNENYRIFDIIKYLKKIKDLDYEFSDQKSDERNYRVSFKKLHKLIKYKPQYRLKRILPLLFKKYQQKKINEKNINFYNDKKIFQILNKKNRSKNLK